MISSTAIFACSDIVATMAYYKDVLGFEADWTYGDPPNFGSATMGGVSLMFNLQPELAAKVKGHQHWIKVDEIDELYRFHRSREARILEEIEDRPWGFREYVVEDPSGYHLRFAGAPLGDVPASKPFPEDVAIERSGPTPEDGTWNGVVARSPDGAPIGSLRIVCDAPGWFSIWGVEVAPEWQARRIGAAMMREALEMIREVSPGALVYLFTTKQGFYERLGFTKETVSMRRV